MGTADIVALTYGDVRNWDADAVDETGNTIRRRKEMPQPQSRGELAENVTMEITVRGEDRYNFNGGQNDIVTGAPDNENGRFTEIGWAKPFDTHGSLTRTVTWQLGDVPDPPPSCWKPRLRPSGCPVHTATHRTRDSRHTGLTP